MTEPDFCYGDRKETGAEVGVALAAIAERLDPTITTGCRVIGPADAAYLTPAERAPLAAAVESVRNASGAARLVARALLRDAGVSVGADLVSRRPDGPVWPAGWLGTLAHDQLVAVAAIAARGRLQGLGVDVEPAEPLPGDIYDLVVTPREHAQIRGDRLAARLLFVVKEAVYKATHPFDGVFLEHHDVDVDLTAGEARTRTGHCVAFAAAYAPRLLAVAALCPSLKSMVPPA